GRGVSVDRPDGRSGGHAGRAGCFGSSAELDPQPRAATGPGQPDSSRRDKNAVSGARASGPATHAVVSAEPENRPVRHRRSPLCFA
nr:hypothetical protein [Tanacetum cinerariifolium]